MQNTRSNILEKIIKRNDNLEALDDDTIFSGHVKPRTAPKQDKD